MNRNNCLSFTCQYEKSDQFSGQKERKYMHCKNSIKTSFFLFKNFIDQSIEIMSHDIVFYFVLTYVIILKSVAVTS